MEKGDRLRRADPWRQTFELRRENPGREITDHLPALEIDPAALDAYSEADPLPELPGAMKNKLMLIARLEAPKWAKRGKLGDYGWGAGRSILRMDLGQTLFERKVAPQKAPDLNQLKREIREFAKSVGYGLCGFTRIDRRFIAEGRDDKFPYDAAVVLGMEMDRGLLEEVPFPGRRLFDFEVYVESGRRVFEVARFIRSRGYRCHARVPFDGWVKYPPHAIMAGLGELGAQGVVITKEYGPRQRWTMISVDADLDPDEPVDLGMAEYCDQCMICVNACPGRAITRERIWWRGVLKRKNNDARCFPIFRKYEGCGICLKVCPINRHGYEACMEAYQKDGTVLGKQGPGAAEFGGPEGAGERRTE
ncbi:MAG TPA: 4Fe-4S dicluster domain-containing protein [bacterium]|nr:4Fe-4S dicluster domain-containing protein [bacterium]